MLTETQRRTLVALVHAFRPDWQTPGIAAAIANTERTIGGAPTDIAAAAIRMAGNLEAKTPALLPLPGPHWGGTATGSRPAPTMCDEHTDQRAATCKPCLDAASAGDHERGARLVRQALRAAKETKP